MCVEVTSLADRHIGYVEWDQLMPYLDHRERVLLERIRLRVLDRIERNDLSTDLDTTG